MSYIFLDESGDLGFNFSKSKTSRFFIISVLFIHDKRPLEKVVKNTHSALKKVHKKRGGTLHSYKESPTTRIRLLRSLNTYELKIMTICLDKSKVYTKLQEEKDILYNYVTNILLDRIFTKKLVDKNQKIHLIASKKETNKFLNLNFKNYLTNQARNNHNINIKVEIKTPFQEKSLQAIDFVCWSMFRKYEHGDDYYYKIIENLIVEENPLFR